MDKIEDLLAMYEAAKAEKQPWLNMYQKVGEYIRQRKLNFTEAGQAGNFTTEEVWNAEPIRAARDSASALLGMLWNGASNSFRLKPPKGGVVEDAERKRFFEQCTQSMHSIMDDQKAGLSLALEEYFSDLVTFGMCGIQIIETKDPATPVKFKSRDVTSLVICEGPDGTVDTCMWEEKFTIKNLIKKYPDVSFPPDIMKAKDEKTKYTKTVTVVYIIMPREDYTNSGGNKDTPVATYHILKDSKFLIEESGFDYMPLIVSRFYKNTGEIQGRSPAIDAMPDVFMTNAMNEAVVKGAEKMLNPPMAGYADAFSTSEKVDLSAGSFLSIDTQAGILPKDAIFPIQTVGDLKSTEFLSNKLSEAIKEDFMVDKLMDFNNKTRMTYGEALIRNEFRGILVGPRVTRQEIEMFTPLITTVFQIALKTGLLGVMESSQDYAWLISKGVQPITIPNSVVKDMQEGRDIFEIEYISPAKRLTRAEALKGVVETLRLASEVSAVLPDAVFKLNANAVMDILAELSGADSRMFYTNEEAQKAKELMQQMQAQAMQADMVSKASAASRDVKLGNQAQAQADRAIMEMED